MNIADPLGQTHLTALGATIQAETILKNHDNTVQRSGIYFPEDLLDSGVKPATILNFFKEQGIIITTENMY